MSLPSKLLHKVRYLLKAETHIVVQFGKKNLTGRFFLFLARLEVVRMRRVDIKPVESA